VRMLRFVQISGRHCQSLPAYGDMKTSSRGMKNCDLRIKSCP
jgi:hypothetical protein